MTAVKYHGGRNYKNRINKHTPNRRNNHPRNPPTPTPKPSLSIPLRSLAMDSPSGKAYRRAPCPLAATCAAALPCHASAAASRRDARARVMASRAIALRRSFPGSVIDRSPGDPSAGGRARLAVASRPRCDILSPRLNMPRSIVKKHASVKSPVKMHHS